MKNKNREEIGAGADPHPGVMMRNAFVLTLLVALAVSGLRRLA